MSKQIWIDVDCLQLGERGFLVRNHHDTKGWNRYHLRDNPPKTSVSFEAKPYGWCGTCSDIATFGEGVWEVIKVAANGRAQLAEVTCPEKLEEFLDEVGYPELLEDILGHIQTVVSH